LCKQNLLLKATRLNKVPSDRDTVKIERNKKDGGVGHGPDLWNRQGPGCQWLWQRCRLTLA
jgi:hypothetical protein